MSMNTKSSSLMDDICGVASVVVVMVIVVVVVVVMVVVEGSRGDVEDYG